MTGRKQKILLIDNYDSFTFNLYQYLAEMAEVAVYKNDAITIELCDQEDPTHVVLSPGPGHPANKADVGQMPIIFEHVKDRLPVLGVCLGHQFIASYFGADVVHAPTVMHGKTSQISHTGTGLFTDIENPCEVMRYHSLMVADAPENFEVTATTDEVIMAMQYKTLPIYGVQFHPESIGTSVGKRLLRNFLR